MEYKFHAGKYHAEGTVVLDTIRSLALVHHDQENREMPGSLVSASDVDILLHCPWQLEQFVANGGNAVPREDINKLSLADSMHSRLTEDDERMVMTYEGHSLEKYYLQLVAFTCVEALLENSSVKAEESIVSFMNVLGLIKDSTATTRQLLSSSVGQIMDSFSQYVSAAKSKRPTRSQKIVLYIFCWQEERPAYSC